MKQDYAGPLIKLKAMLVRVDDLAARHQFNRAIELLETGLGDYLSMHAAIYRLRDEHDARQAKTFRNDAEFQALAP